MSHEEVVAWHYDGKYSCIWNYLLYGYIVVSG